MSGPARRRSVRHLFAVEINEAFAAVSVQSIRTLGVSAEVVNTRGAAIVSDTLAESEDGCWYLRSTYRSLFLVPSFHTTLNRRRPLRHLAAGRGIDPLKTGPAVWPASPYDSACMEA